MNTRVPQFPRTSPAGIDGHGQTVPSPRTCKFAQIGLQCDCPNFHRSPMHEMIFDLRISEIRYGLPLVPFCRPLPLTFFSIDNEKKWHHDLSQLVIDQHRRQRTLEQTQIYTYTFVHLCMRQNFGPLLIGARGSTSPSKNHHCP